MLINMCEKHLQVIQVWKAAPLRGECSLEAVVAELAADGRNKTRHKSTNRQSSNQ
jgi:hypothetical protein